MAVDKKDRITDIGPPNYEQFLPEIIKKNYGKWAWHEIIKPGVLMTVAESGDKLYSVRAASPRLVSIPAGRILPSLGLMMVLSSSSRRVGALSLSMQAGPSYHHYVRKQPVCKSAAKRQIQRFP